MITLSNGLSLSFATNLALEAKKDSNGNSLSAIAGNNHIEINDETLKKHELQMKTDAILNGTKSYFMGSFYRHDYQITDLMLGYYTTTERTSLNKTSMLNDYGRSNILKTPVGDMEVFLDLEGDNDKYGVGKLEYLGQLINLDVNKDGFLDSSDEFFDKLKLRGYNSAGEEVILKFSDVYKALDLTKFVHTQKDVDKARANRDTISNGTSLFAPELSYKKIESQDLKKLFEVYADESGWIDLSKTYIDKEGKKNYVYWDFMNSFNFAFKSPMLNGSTRLETFAMSPFDEEMMKEFGYKDYKGFRDSKMDLASEVKFRFDYMYQNYYDKDADFITELSIRREFQKLTGMEFSESRFKEIYEGLNSNNPEIMQKYVNALDGGLDAVNGLKLNDDGSITLRFVSGKTINVNELYMSNGEFNLTNTGQVASVMTEASEMSEEKLNELDFTQIGTDSNGSIVSLAELGVEFIQKTIFANGQNAFILTTGDGKEMVVANLYKIRSVEDMVRFGEIDEEEKLRIKYEWDA